MKIAEILKIVEKSNKFFTIAVRDGRGQVKTYTFHK